VWWNGLGKTYCMEFNSKYINHHEMLIKYNSKTIANVLILHDIVCCKSHIDMLTSKLNKACYMVRVLTPLLSLDSLEKIYNVYFHSVITYGLIFRTTSTHSLNIFKLHKCIVRILKGARPRDYCRDFFFNFKYITFSIPVLALSGFVYGY
jgi:hypothetical protein